MADERKIVNFNDRPWDYSDITFWKNPEDDTTNAIVEIDGQKARARAAMLIVKDGKEILLGEEKDEPGVFSLPGGGIEEDETAKEAAERECNEEVKLEVKNIHETGHDYLETHTEVKDWVKDNVPEKYQWINYYTCLCIGEYDGKFDGKVDKEDQDPNMKKTSKFYPIKDVINDESFKLQWKKALFDAGYIKRKPIKESFKKLDIKGINDPVYVTDEAYKVANLIKRGNIAYRIFVEQNGEKTEYYFTNGENNVTHSDLIVAMNKAGWTTQDYLNSDIEEPINDNQSIITVPNSADPDSMTYAAKLGEDGYSSKRVYDFGEVLVRDKSAYNWSLFAALGTPIKTVDIDEEDITEAVNSCSLTEAEATADEKAKLIQKLSAAMADFKAMFGNSGWLCFDKIHYTLSRAESTVGDYCESKEQIRVSSTLAHETDEEVKNVIYHEFCHFVADKLQEHCCAFTSECSDWNTFNYRYNLKERYPKVFKRNTFIFNLTSDIINPNTGELIYDTEADGGQNLPRAVRYVNEYYNRYGDLKGMPKDVFGIDNCIMYTKQEDNKLAGHGTVWQYVAKALNETAGTNITRFYSNKNNLQIKKADTTKYVCDKCGFSWTDRSRKLMPDRGSWTHRKCGGYVHVYDIRNGQEKEIPQRWQMQKESLEEGITKHYYYSGPAWKYNDYIGNVILETDAANDGRAYTNLLDQLTHKLGYSSGSIKVKIDKSRIKSSLPPIQFHNTEKCPKCGTLLTDFGECPKCDFDDLGEALNVNDPRSARLLKICNNTRDEFKSLFGDKFPFDNITFKISTDIGRAAGRTNVDIKNNSCTVMLSAMLFDETDEELRDVVAHELCHFCARFMLLNLIDYDNPRFTLLGEPRPTSWEQLKDYDLHKLCPKVFTWQQFLFNGAVHRSIFTGEKIGGSYSNYSSAKAVGRSLMDGYKEEMPDIPADFFNEYNIFIYNQGQELRTHNHGNLWRYLAERVNTLLGTHIKQNYFNSNDLAIMDDAVARVICTKCGGSYKTNDHSALTPGMYHHRGPEKGCKDGKCGGLLRVIDLRTGKEIPQLWQKTKATEDLKDDAKEHFGTTNKWWLGIYINTDGTVLDGSGKTLGSRGINRAVDHREVSDIMSDGTDGSAAMIKYMQEGNIRWMPECPGCELMKEPNAKQYSALKHLLTTMDNDEFSVDIDNEKGNVIKSLHYDYIQPARIITDIQKYFSHILTEDTRIQLIGKSRNAGEYKDKSRGKNRFERKRFSKIATQVKQYNQLDMNMLFKQDILQVGIPVTGETDNYTVTVKIDGVVAEIAKNIKNNKNDLEFRTIIQALTRMFNTSNVYVKCTCDDFKYNFEHWSIINNFGVDDTAHDPGPGKNIRNPLNDKGKGCKHILLVLNNGDWMMKVASVINNYIHFMADHKSALFLKLIFPKLYGVPAEDMVEKGLVDDEKFLKSSTGLIDAINAYGKNRGKIKPGTNQNPVQKAKEQKQQQKQKMPAMPEQKPAVKPEEKKPAEPVKNEPEADKK